MPKTKAFLPWWWCIWNTSASWNRTQWLLQGLCARPCLMETLAQTTSGWWTPVPFLYTFIYTDAYTCAHTLVSAPRGKPLPSQLFLRSSDYRWELSEWFPSWYGLGLQWRTLSGVLLKDMPSCQKKKPCGAERFHTDFPITPPPLLSSLFAALSLGQSFSVRVSGFQWGQLWSQDAEQWNRVPPKMDVAFPKQNPSFFYSFISSQLLRKQEFQQHLLNPHLTPRTASSKYPLACGLRIPATCTYAKSV